MSKKICIGSVARLTAIGLLLAATGVSADNGPSVTFIEDVRPILETSCVKCHGENEVHGGLQLFRKDLFLKGGRSGPVAVAGDAAHSLIIERVSLPANDEHVMPHKGPHLTPAQIETFTKWINGGMHWPDSLVLRDRSPGDAAGAAVGNGLKRCNLGRDLPPASPAVVDQLLKEDNHDQPDLVYGPPLSDLAFLRKASVDLIGRIPTDDEVRDYLNRPAAQRRRKTVETLSQNPRLADRWTAFYADMLQIRTKAAGGEQLMMYVHRCIENGKPYDELARDLIAASGAPNASPAVGFILGHYADPMSLAGATSQSFLGVRLACAQCHDHPFDKWSQQQFYEFAGWFGKTKRNDHGKGGDGYVYETDEMSVRWPPEGKTAEAKRRGVEPDFLFNLETFTNPPPSFLTRYEQKHQQWRATQAKQHATDEFDGQLDNLLTSRPAPGMASLDAELEKKARADAMLALQPGVVRAALAERLTSPRNRYFARAFVNRVWADLMGRGFYEPVDDFRDDTIVSHPRTLEYLADEFVASGFDLASLLRMIVNTEAYQRGHLGAGVTQAARQQSAAAFVAAPWRRMPAESLYDSLVVAGHLFSYKWPAGANMKQIDERISYKVVVGTNQTGAAASTNSPSMMGGGYMRSTDATDGYDLEDAAMLSLNADANTGEEAGQLTTMLDVMREDAAPDLTVKKDKPKIKEKEMYKTVTKTVDDNPKFSSAFRTESPAPPAHFLRVFGQPARERLGDFRDQTPSLRQELMMLNGRLSHEASRVGPSEPLYYMLASDKPEPEKAVRQAYLGALTREPTPDELTEALGILHEAPSLLEGMADLRWVLLNCDEFRYLP
jgi:hypothetical protein